MSSIYSDPPFPRGGSLLGFDPADAATLDEAGNPIQGRDIVGEVKVFTDSNPVTGAVNSQRLVYCVAVRVRQAGVANGQPANNLTPGKVVKFAAGSLTTLDADNQAAATDTANIAHQVGVVDEYLPKVPLVNDLIWVVVKGPTTALFTSAAVAAGAPVAVSSTPGSLVAANTPAVTSTFFGTALTAKASGATGTARVSVANADF